MGIFLILNRFRPRHFQGFDVILPFIGIIAEAVGAEWALGGMATLLVVMSLGFFVFSPLLRRLD